MKKLLPITLCLLMVMASASFATNTRVLTMGENNEILLDEANIWLYPARIYDYPDLAIAEFKGYSSGFATKGTEQFDGDDYYFHDFGVHWKFGEEKPFVLGTYFSNSQGQTDDEAYLGALMLPVGLGNSGYDYPSKAGFYDLFPSGLFGQVPDLDYFSTDYTNRRIGLFYGRMLGQQKFGFSFQYLHSSAKYEEDNGNGLEDERDQSFTRFNFGLGLTDGQGKWDLGANIQFITWTDKVWDFSNDVIYERTKPSGNIVFDVNGRYFYQYNSVITFVPHGRIMFGKFESEAYTAVDDVDAYVSKYNLLSLQGGWGMNYQPTANMLAVLDFGIAYSKLDEEFTNNDVDPVEVDEDNVKVFTLPYFRLGFEGEVFSWMDARFGATSYWRNFEREGIADGATDWKETENGPANMTYLGFSFHWGNLTVDTWSDPELFLEGFNFISGDGQDMNAGISALYSF